MFEILTYALAKSKAAKEVKAAVSDKLDKPANPTIGQLLRVKSISDDGDIVLETVAGGGGSGLPEGGTAGQALVKKSDDNFNVEWGNKPYFLTLPLKYSQDELVKIYKENGIIVYYESRAFIICVAYGNDLYGIGYTSISNKKGTFTQCSIINGKFSYTSTTGNFLPIGGKTNQLLSKKSNTDGDAQWIDPQTATVRTTMDDVAVAGVKYFLGEQTALSITMPTDAQTGQEIMVVFSSGDTPCTLSIDLDDFDYVPKANTTCKITFTCIDTDTWLVDVKEG